MDQKAKQKLFELADYYEGRALSNEDATLESYCQVRCDAISSVLVALDIETEYIDWQLDQ